MGNGMLQKTIYTIINDNLKKGVVDDYIRYISTSETQEYRNRRTEKYCVINRPDFSPTGKTLLNGDTEKDVTLDIDLKLINKTNVSGKSVWVKNMAVRIKNLLKTNEQTIYDILYHKSFISIKFNPGEDENDIRESSAVITLKCITWADLEEES